MKELLLYMAKNLVDEPEAVTVTEVSDEEGKVLELRVAPSDMGKVIGRQGRIAKEIRTIVKTVAQRTGERSQWKSWINGLCVTLAPRIFRFLGGYYAKNIH